MREMDGDGVSHVRGYAEEGGRRAVRARIEVTREEPEERLPEDILERIQAYLPITDFFRSRLVCKTWHARLMCPAFRKMHAELAPKEEWVLTLSHNDYPRTYLNFSCAYSPRSKKWVSFPKVCPYFPSGNIVASEGIVCFQDGEDQSRNVIIYDSCVGSWKVVPVSSFMLKSRLQLVGFVRDPGSKEFKVFGMCYTSGQRTSTVMYDSRKGEWVVTGTTQLFLGRRIERTVVWRGFVYVVGRNIEPGAFLVNKVMKCSVEDGVWRPVPSSFGIPRGASRSDVPGLDLVVLKDRLFAVERTDDKVQYFPITPEGGVGGVVLEILEGMSVPTSYRGPFYYLDDWAGAFAGRDNFLYIQVSNKTSRVVVCDLSRTPGSWWPLPRSPAGDKDDGTLVAMAVQPELDAFVGSQS